MRLVLSLVLLLLAVSEARAQLYQYRVNETRTLAWDYDFDVTGLRFEIRFDNGTPYTSGTTKQLVIPQLVVGIHNVQIVACRNSDNVCGPSDGLSFEVLPLTGPGGGGGTPPAPEKPGNIRILPPPPTTLLSIQQATEMAQSYAFLLRLDKLAQWELKILNDEYNGPLPFTYGSVMNYLQAKLVYGQ